MSDDYHSPENEKLTSDLLADLDGKVLALQSNALIGGSMLGEGALKMARMVMLTALRAPGTEVVVAGFAARVRDGKLSFWMQGEPVSRDLTEPLTEIL